MAKQRKQARGGGRRVTHPVLAPIVEKLRTEYGGIGLSPEQDRRIDRLAAQLHRAGAPEEDKLIEKDRLLIDLVADFKKGIRAEFAAGNITRVEALLFARVSVIMVAIEDVLWELKGQKGPKPEPRPLPEGDPDPSPRPPKK